MASDRHAEACGLGRPALSTSLSGRKHRMGSSFLRFLEDSCVLRTCISDSEKTTSHSCHLVWSFHEKLLKEVPWLKKLGRWWVDKIKEIYFKAQFLMTSQVLLYGFENLWDAFLSRICPRNLYFLECPIGLRFHRTHLGNYQLGEIKSWKLLLLPSHTRLHF